MAAENSSRRAAAPADKPLKKDPERLRGRFALDFAALQGDSADQLGIDRAASRAMSRTTATRNPALLRLQALRERDRTAAPDRPAMAPVDPAQANWTPLGPLAVPNGQTYGGARVLISGRVTAIAPHPTDGATIYLGTSRGGVWRTQDGGDTWTALGDNQPSLAIGALGVC